MGGSVRLPRTSARRQSGFCRLLTAVDLGAPVGLQFVGPVLPLGARIEAAALPNPAVLIECAGSDRVRAGRSRYCFRHLWLLWRFDFAAEEWVEVLRLHADSSEWTIPVAPVAFALLYPDPRRRRHLVAAEANAVTERIVGFLQGEFESLHSEVCCEVLAGVDTFLASEIVTRSRPAEF